MTTRTEGTRRRSGGTVQRRNKSLNMFRKNPWVKEQQRLRKDRESAKSGLPTHQSPMLYNGSLLVPYSEQSI